MLLTRNRIWGNVIGGNNRSGYKELKRALRGPSTSKYYEFSNVKMVNPFVKDWSKINLRKEKYEERKLRIFMRGVKIGSRKVSNTGNNEMFSMSKSDTAADGQKTAESLAKASMSDASLDL
eukprot:CAMPEP_0176385470 /NCGR_PEP_ID=MMETSP0126-20121128/35183_1 /TAXON_ID=141414 ORGANISM="Strombidinopsis acuminatum, Strain SPMC142" /NCGR_SAMPLE_ID=MMETSP0126 /ASSEMBLY_ACC=CAM_ASM_000229 /LENGTH=120 /DNA_ID=CAMNT_0017751865 /DNA_START=117 /DNA_END=479 /DNA_ORIENTATION=+